VRSPEQASELLVQSAVVDPDTLLAAEPAAGDAAEDATAADVVAAEPASAEAAAGVEPAADEESAVVTGTETKPAEGCTDEVWTTEALA